MPFSTDQNSIFIFSEVKLDILTIKNLATFQAAMTNVQAQLEKINVTLASFETRIESLEEKTQRINQRKQYPCDQCSTVLYTKHNFNRHKRFHEKQIQKNLSPKEWF